MFRLLHRILESNDNADEEDDKKEEVPETPEEQLMQSLVFDKEKDEDDTKKICEHIEPAYMDQLSAKTDGFTCTSEKENVIVAFKVDADNEKLTGIKTKSGSEEFKKLLNEKLSLVTLITIKFNVIEIGREQVKCRELICIDEDLHLIRI